MKEFLILHKFNGTEIMIRKSAVQDLSVNEGVTIVGMCGSEENYFRVKETYDEVKEMLLDGRD